MDRIMNPCWWASMIPILFLSGRFALKLLSKPNSKARSLPPGPSPISILTTVCWHWLSSKDNFDIDAILRRLRAKHGPILTIPIPSRPTIFIADRSLAHHALVHCGATFAGRLPTALLNISLLPPGPLWRSLRRNLTSEILHPSRIKQFADDRNRVLGILLDELNRARAEESSTNGVVTVIDSFQFAMFCLLVLVCFGDKNMDLGMIREIEDVQKSLHTPIVLKLNVVGVFPRITKMVFWKSWRKLLGILRRQEDILIPLIRSSVSCSSSSYAKSLLELSVTEEGGRRLSEGEIVGLCSEFLGASSYTTGTALEWTMAELVKHPEIQKKMLAEIRKSVPADKEVITEEDLPKMPYLSDSVHVWSGTEKAAAPPAGAPCRASGGDQDVETGGYVVPKGASVNFMVAEMGWDEKVWEEPMEFRPEMFLAGVCWGVDITGSREMKMMPFGAGRRICPGLALAMLHLEYFIANLVREFEWRAVDGEVDLSEKLELTVVMKNHLRAKIVPRR